MDSHPIENLMKTTMENIKNMVDVNTIIGDTINCGDGISVIPVSKLSFGFASGGSEFSESKHRESLLKYPFGGGAGAGVTVKPVAFIVIKNDTIRLLPVEYDSTYDKALDSIPQIIEMFKSMSKSKEKKCEDKEKENKE
ncbi:GerW family sporulation protein [Clostridium omnivorum]|uniref:Sporulation protein YtfJ n=1 Tax=Clostridium omnivorum TaxID=1604902 RepID=A0ABQ5NBH9_9CLOT|nr:GerW family sporulation protein [Clostridium sp. E14]GLC32451.1 sporulation protein YtfJ [Clostridium sp. E14]